MKTDTELTMSMFANSAYYWKAKYEQALIQVATLEQENELLRDKVLSAELQISESESELDRIISGIQDLIGGEYED